VKALLVGVEHGEGRRIRELLEAGRGLEIVGECGGLEASAAKLRELVPESPPRDGDAPLGGAKSAFVLVAANAMLRWIDHQASARPRRLTLKAVGRITFVDPAEVEWIDACGTGARVHSTVGTHDVTQSIGVFESELANEGFLRTHRSTLVNLSRVRSRELGPHGDHVLIMVSGKRLTIGRSYRERVRRALEGV
jgi:hypothetical protein